MQYTSRTPRKPSFGAVSPRPERAIHVDLKFTQTGKYLIAAGSDRQPGHDYFSPVLYISVVGEKSWAVHYPLEGVFTKDDDAAAAALHYGIQIITRQLKDVPLPGDPRTFPVVSP